MIKIYINNNLYYELNFKFKLINLYISYKYYDEYNNDKIIIDTTDIDIQDLINHLIQYDKFIQILIEIGYKLNLIIRVNIKNINNKNLIINHNSNYPYVYNIIGNNNKINELYLSNMYNILLYIEKIKFYKINKDIYYNENIKFKNCEINNIIENML